MKKLIVTLQLLLVFFTAVAQDSTAVFFSNYISPSLIKQHLEVLASDSLEGRETAAPGMVKAANYVSSQYEKLGLPTLANGTRFQEFPLVNLIAGMDYYLSKNLSLGAEFGFGFYSTKYDDLKSDYLDVKTPWIESEPDVNNVSTITAAQTTTTKSNTSLKQGKDSGFGPNVTAKIKLGWLF